MYPTSVNVDEKALNKLTATYKTAEKEILEEITTSTDFGVKYRKGLLNQIDAILEDLGKQTQDLIESEIPRQYEQGANQAVKQLENIDAPLRVPTGFSKIHQDAVQALVDETAKAFGESLTGVGRSANAILSKGVKEQITQKLASGTIKGDALRQVKNSVVGAIQQQGLTGLVDKGGHKWTLDRYSEMLIRTKSVEARNRGLINRMVENSYDLVQVSSHGAKDVCGRWEGEILSMTGKTSGYKTVAQAEDDGLFHPNCKHAVNAMHLDLAKQTMAWNTDTQQYEKGLIGKKLSSKINPKIIKPKTNTYTINNKTYTTNSFETTLANKHNLEVRSEKIKSNLINGRFTTGFENNKEYNHIAFGRKIVDKTDAQIEHTFRHEFGHFVDHRMLEKKQNYYGRTVANFLSENKEYKQALKPEYAKQMAIERIKKSPDFKDYADDDIAKMLKGEFVKGLGIRPKMRSYVRSYSELFAESYARYRINPKLLKKNMPELFDYFKKLE